LKTDVIITQDEVKNIFGTINELEDIECDFEWLSDTTEEMVSRPSYLSCFDGIN